jgi:hypothetical protein
MRITRSVLRAQEIVAEQNTTKGASPTGVLYSLAAYWRRTVTVLLGEVTLYYIILIIYYIINIYFRSI